MFNHFGRPPVNQGFFEGPPVSECWVGLNDLTAVNSGLYAIPCDANSNFSITGIPAGIYQLVTWDKPLDALFGFNTVTIPDINGNFVIDLGKVLSFRWFGTFEGSVFYDANQNGFRDCVTPACDNAALGDEVGIPEQNINIRFRDGSIYQAQPTDVSGEYSFTEVFPFFKWLVTEVDFARFKATGMTTAVDYGGLIPPANGWIMPSFDKLNPQPQVAVNPNTGNNLSRTETGPVLTQAMMLFLNQTNVADWGKTDYQRGENGGISGVVYYDVTRDVNDPRYAAPQPWEPGIPGVQINLYQDFNNDGVPDGPAIDSVFTDSWDENKPSGCIQDLPVVHGVTAPECFDNYGTWNQMRPGLFDGGYAFGPNLPRGTYIVEAIPPAGYELVKEEDKNVDFGESYAPALLPPVCVGAPHLVPAELSLFPGISGFYAGQTRPLCDRKQIVVSDGKNAAADFFLFTEVPKAARAVGFTNNDLTAEFNAQSPIFGEKASPSWIPISFQDFNGREIVRVYSDEFGSYNALLPSSYTVNVPNPSGVSPNMITLVLNHPTLPDGSIDPWYDPNYSVTPWTFDYWPAKTTYLDTPLVPIAAFTAYPKGGPDVEPPAGTPVIRAVNGPTGGPIACAAGEIISITAMGNTQVSNPDYDPNIAGSTPLITRDYGFGVPEGTVMIGGITVDPSDVTWSANSIMVTVPVGASTGQLVIMRGDTGRTTWTGITLHIGVCGANVLHVVQGQSIQAAIDAAAIGDLIIVEPGTYNENVILYKNVRLQGSGAGSTFLNASATPDRLAQWHAKIASILGNDPFLANEAPGIMVLGNAGFSFDQVNPASIDGFRIFGAISGGGIFVNSDAHYLTISNNKISGNQGFYSGGISLGTPDTGLSANNSNVMVVYNHVIKNGGVNGGGGLSVYNGADGYSVMHNFIGGNFSRYYGGGILHYGLSDNGLIAQNRIVFNEVFYGAAAIAFGDGGGIYVGGEIAPAVLSEGAGNVTINANLIQGNLSGAGNGGGIRVNAFNGTDTAGPQAGWYALSITNNMVVNNVAGLAGGGIALQDAVNVSIINNTIANNDSTATAANAFAPGSLDSTPQGAGIVSGAHSAGLATNTGQVFSDPLLVNNIIWHNRSFFNDHTLNGGAGGLAPNPAGIYQDFEVKVPLQIFNPEYCLLTDPAGFAGTNITGDPMFISQYMNSLVIATVLDEGGNAISVRYTPLKLLSDYHIQGISPAKDTGDPIRFITLDYDGQLRPFGPGPDMGADEVTTSISVLVPNGGENWGVNTTRTIYWAYTGNPGANVRIDLLRNGTLFQTVAASVPIGTGGIGSYSWLIPSSIGGRGGGIPFDTTYQIQVTSTTNSIYTDMSDAPFTISAVGTNCSYTLAPPGTNAAIGGGPGSFAVTTQAGCPWSATTATPWLSVTAPAGLVVGSATVDYTVGDNTGNPPRTGTITAGGMTFTVNQAGIVPPDTITVVAPNGGETWTLGSVRTIQWTYTGAPGPNVRIELLMNGTLLRTIAASVSTGTGGNGSFVWTVPSRGMATGSTFAVRVTSITNGTITDTSDAFFTVSP